MLKNKYKSTEKYRGMETAHLLRGDACQLRPRPANLPHADFSAS